MPVSNPITEAERLVALAMFDEAIEALHRLPVDRLFGAKPYMVRMQCAVGLKEWEMAEVLASVLRFEPGFRAEAAFTYQTLGIEYLRLGEIAKAKEMIRTAIDVWSEQRQRIVDDPRITGLS